LPVSVHGGKNKDVILVKRSRREIRVTRANKGRERTYISRHRGKKPFANYADRFTPGERNRSGGNEVTYKVRVSLYSKKRYETSSAAVRLTLPRSYASKSPGYELGHNVAHMHGAIRCTFAPIRQVVFGRSYRSITAKERCTPHARDTSH